VNKTPSKDPLEGITLEMMLNALIEHFGWDKLGQIIPVRCFQNNPSIKSSLNFLRRTPWARQKIEQLFRQLQSGKAAQPKT
jgi:uncharacterized protein (DUF2132 family)